MAHFGAGHGPFWVPSTLPKTNADSPLKDGDWETIFFWNGKISGAMSVLGRVTVLSNGKKQFRFGNAIVEYLDAIYIDLASKGWYDAIWCSKSPVVGVCYWGFVCRLSNRSLSGGISLPICWWLQHHWVSFETYNKKWVLRFNQFPNPRDRFMLEPISINLQFCMTMITGVLELSSYQWLPWATKESKSSGCVELQFGRPRHFWSFQRPFSKWGGADFFLGRPGSSSRSPPLKKKWAWWVSTKHLSNSTSHLLHLGGRPACFGENIDAHDAGAFGSFKETRPLLGSNIYPFKGILKMICLFPRWDMLVPWRFPKILPFTTYGFTATEHTSYFQQVKSLTCGEREFHVTWAAPRSPTKKNADSSLKSICNYIHILLDIHQDVLWEGFCS